MSTPIAPVHMSLVAFCVQTAIALSAAQACSPQLNGDSWFGASPDRPKEFWQKNAMLLKLKRGMQKTSVMRVVESLQDKRYPAREFGRGIADGMECHAFYPLDEDWELHVQYGPKWPRCEWVKSFEVVGFPDLKHQIAPRMFPFLRLIHQSPRIQGRGFDPVALIRAVNALRMLGKEGAIEALRTYHELATSDDPSLFRYDLDEQRVFLIAMLLFVRKDGVRRMPMLHIGATDLDQRRGNTSEEWPVFPLAIQDDCPFLLVTGYTLTSGLPESPMDYLSYCYSHCKVRRRPLVPKRSPLESVDRLLASKRSQRLGIRDEPWRTAMLRQQSVRSIWMINEVRSQKAVSRFLSTGTLNDAEWRNVREALSKTSFGWDSSTQRFRLVSRYR